MPIRYLSGLSVDSTVLVVDAANDRVGIGTASPNSILEISALTPVFRIQASDTANFHGIEFRQGAGFDAFIKQLPVSGEFRISNGRSVAWGGFITFYTDTVERLRITPAGNVGIGTTAPAYKFNVITDAVSGRQNLAAIDRTAQNFITFTNPQYSVEASMGLMLRVFPQSDARQGAGIIASGGSLNGETDLSLFVSSGVGSSVSYGALNIKGDTGNVGIGTTSPAGKLHIRGSAASITPSSVGNLLVLEDTENGISILSSTAGAGYLIFGDTADNDVGQIIYDHSANSMNFWANASERMRITSAGNVGIGTTSPAGKLDVRAGSGGKIILGSYDANFNVTIEGGDQLNFYNGASATTGYINYNGPGNILLSRNLYVEGNSSGGSSGSVRIDSAGNVGIGTTSPGAVLHISRGVNNLPTVFRIENVDTTIETAQEVNSIEFYTNDGSASGTGITSKIVQIAENPGNQYGLSIYSYNLALVEAVRISNNGNVGIGTTSPAAKLDVNGTISASGEINSISNNARISLYRSTGTNYFDWSSGQPLYFSTETTAGGSGRSTKMVLLDNGNVGIGTTSPGELLEVVGNIRANVSNGGGFMLTGASASGLVRAGATGLALRTDTTDRLTIDNSGAATFSSSVTTGGIVSIATTQPYLNLLYAGVTEWRIGMTSLSSSSLLFNANGVTRLTIAEAGAATFSSSVTASSLIKSGGTASQYLMADGSVSTLTNPVTGTGTTNYVPKFTSASAIGNSQIFDNGTNVGIGTASPIAKLTINQLPVAESGSTSYGTAVIHGINYNLSNTQRGIVDINYIDVGAQDNGSTLTFTNNAGMFGQGNSFVGVGLKAGKSNATNQDQSTYFAISTNNTGSLTEKLRITNTGNVGIGTTSPGSKLEVSGGLAHFAQTATTGSAFRWGSFGTAVSPDTMLCMNQLWNGSGWTILDANYGTTAINLGGTEASPAMRFETGGANTSATTKMIILNNGNVGIGTTAPGAKLQVGGSSTDTELLRLSISYDSSRSARGGINWRDGSDTTGRIYTDFDGSMVSMVFGSLYNSGYNSNNLMIIRGNGNVGIGTTSPTQKLDVATGNIALGYNQTATNSLYKDFATYHAAGNVPSELSMVIYDGSPGAVRIKNTRTGSYNSQAIHFDVHEGGVATRGDAMIINYTGNVGIGTASPASTVLLDLKEPDAATDLIIGLSAGTGGRSQIRSVAQANGTTSELSFHTVASSSTAEHMRITAAGNVGIGTTSPSNKLQVIGGVTIGSASVATVNLYLTRTNGGIVADANYFVSGNNTPNQTWIEGGYYTGELTGVVTAPNSGYPYFEAYSGQGSATAKSFGFVNKTSGSFISTDFLYTMGLLRTGQIRFNQYGSGSFTGTVAYNLAVDSSGNIIETAGGVVDGSGTANYVSKWSDANTLTNSVLYDDGTNVGIGTTSPAYKLDVAGSLNVAANVYNYIGGNKAFGGNGSTFLYLYTGTTALSILNNADSSELVRITNAGNVGIGTTSPTTAKLVISQTGGTQLHLISGDSSGSTDVVIRLTSGIDYRGRGILMDNSGASGSWYAGVPYTGGSYSIGYDTTQSEYLANSKFFINTSGNVGIGTTAPAFKLEVNAGSNAGMWLQGSSDVRYHAFSSSSNDWVGYELRSSNVNSFAGGMFRNNGANNRVSLYNKNSEAISLMDTGNVGIGTTAPGYKLEVDGGPINIVNGYSEPTSEAGYRLKFADNGGINNDSGIGLSGSLASESLWINKGSANGNIRFMFGTLGEKVTFTSAGNVGIGTTAPSDKLSVYQGNFTVKGDSVDGGIVNIVRRYSTGPQTIRFWNNHPTTNLDWVGARIESADAGNYNGYLDFAVSLGNNANEAAGTAAVSSVMRLTKDARVGIGTTAPDSLLHISGSGNTFTRYTNTTSAGHYIDIGANSAGQSFVYGYGAYPLLFATNGSEAMRITSAGNVGIGTTSPSGKLHVYGGSFITDLDATYHQGILNEYVSTYVSRTKFGRWNTSSNLEIYYDIAGSEEARITRNYSAAVLKFDRAGTTDMIISGSGNVGIGITNPVSPLQVNGTAQFGDVGSMTFSGASVNIRTTATGSIALTHTAVRTYTLGIDSSGTFNIRDYDAPADRLSITSGGNVGIGTTGPTEKLHVDGSTLITYNNSFQSTNSVGNKAILARVSPTSGIVNYAEYATATNLNGFVIGSDDARVKGNIATDSLEFITNTSTRMTILSGGNVGINTTTPGSTLHVIGDVLIQTGALGVGVNPNATDGRIDASNDIVAFSTSDKRLKENITPIANALEKVRSLTGVEFDWKEETKSVHGYEGHDVGVIAQDVQAVLPEAVRTNDSGYLSVRYEKMIALLVEANKELADRVEQLEKLIK